MEKVAVVSTGSGIAFLGFRFMAGAPAGRLGVAENRGRLMMVDGVKAGVEGT